MTSVLRRYITEYTDANSWRYPIRRRVTFASALEFSMIASSANMKLFYAAYTILLRLYLFIF